ncbi:MAG: MATE family efflux transporter [Dialister invisus]
MHIDISSRFNYERLFRFVLPSVVMMIFISTYTMVDGFFVSNYVGKTAFTAVNLIFPAIMVFACVGFMFGSGGSALVAKTMGEEQMEKANRLFLSSSFLLCRRHIAFRPGLLPYAPSCRLYGCLR